MAGGEQVLTVPQMRAAEQALVVGGESVSSLMERAGRGTAQWVWRVAGHRPITVLCGPGNNGGDGYVIARELRARGAEVRVVAALAPQTDAAIAARQSYEGPIVEEASGGVFVDCLFGSGLTRPLEPQHSALLGRLASAHSTSMAVDVPSGIESDSGAVLNDDLPVFSHTLALGAWKRAHWLAPGMALMGQRRLVDIGIAPVADAACLIGRPHLHPPSLEAHKYSRGLLAVVGGAMPGAGVLAARAAMRSGAGYVKLFAPHTPSSAPAELVVNDDPLDRLLRDERLSALLVGPGLGRDRTAEGRLRAVLARDLPTVLDADALVLLTPFMLTERSAPLLLTPHAGELAHLCDRFGIVGEDRITRSFALARSSGAVVIAKGPDTLVATPEGALRFSPAATSWLSTAGTGDVLAGILASRLAAGSGALAAAEEAVWLHGEAARLAGVVLTAADLVRALPAAYARCL